jgi:hypothetical protein
LGTIPLALLLSRRRPLGLVRSIFLFVAVGFILLTGTQSSLAQYPNYPNVFNSIIGNIMRQAPPPSYRPAPAYQPTTPNPQPYQPPRPQAYQPQNQYYQEQDHPSSKRAAPASGPTTSPTTSTLTKAEKDAIESVKKEMIQKGLIDGPQDITVLIVAHDSQDITRNLAGDPQFAKSASVCFPFKQMDTDLSTPEGRFLSYVEEKIKRKGNGGLMPNQCNDKNFGQFDILIFSLEQLNVEYNTAIKPNIAKGVLAAYNDGAFKKFDEIYRRSDFEAENQKRLDAIAADEQRRAQEKQKAEDDFKARDGDAISAIFLKTSGGAACIGGGSDSHMPDLVKRSDSPFVDLIAKAAGTHQISDANALFIALKKHDCFAAIGPTKDLRELAAALNRDNVGFDYDPGEIAATRVDEGGDKDGPGPTSSR